MEPAPRQRANVCAEGPLGRAQQFLAAVATRQNEASDARMRALCPNSESWRLLARLGPYDRRHALAVYDLLVASGCDDEDVLLAGLFHDIGKADERARVHLVDRVGLVLGCAIAPGAVKRRTTSRSKTRAWHGLYLASEHARLGADAARQAGLSPRTCALIAAHDGTAALDDPGLALLYWADRRAL